jgi:hypothetical protein
MYFTLCSCIARIGARCPLHLTELLPQPRPAMRTDLRHEGSPRPLVLKSWLARDLWPPYWQRWPPFGSRMRGWMKGHMSRRLALPRAWIPARNTASRMLGTLGGHRAAWRSDLEEAGSTWKPSRSHVSIVYFWRGFRATSSRCQSNFRYAAVSL